MANEQSEHIVVIVDLSEEDSRWFGGSRFEVRRLQATDGIPVVVDRRRFARGDAAEVYARSLAEKGA